MQKTCCAGTVCIITWSGSIYYAVLCLVASSCLTHCDPMGCSPPGSSVHGLFQTRILERVANPFSRDRTQVSHIAGKFFIV